MFLTIKPITVNKFIKYKKMPEAASVVSDYTNPLLDSC